jgi:AcrR family transcriptional regulator
MRSATKPYHHGALERALTDEAVRQVRERGTEQVSLRGIAQTVGVSPSAAYQHFPDKAALLHAVCMAGSEELADRMTAGVDAVQAEGDAGTVERFLAVGQAYVEFARAEPHLFRHIFGPSGAEVHDAMAFPTTPAEGEAGPNPEPEMARAYAILLERIAELAERGLLRPGIEETPLDVLAWSLVHGFSSLVVDGFLPFEAGTGVLRLFGRLVLTDEAFATLAAALTDAA